MEQQRQIETSPARKILRLGARIFAYGIVGGWSAMFLIVAYCVSAPLLFTKVFLDPATNEVAGDFLTALGACVAVATTSLSLLRRGVRGSARKWLAFFYGFEAPLILLIAARLFVLREITPGTGFVFGTTIIGCLSVAWHVHRPFSQSRTWAHAQLVAASLGIVASSSLAAYIALYVPVAGASFADWIFSASTWTGFYNQLVYSRGFAVLWGITGMLFALMSATFFLAAPFGLIAALARHFRDQVRFHLLRFQAPWTTFGIVALCLGTTIASWILSSKQRAPGTLAKVEAHMLSPSLASLDHIYEQEAETRAALLDAYLAPYRYVGASGSTNHLREMYNHSMLRGPLADAMQSAHDVIARPFLYDGASLTADQDRAALYYEQLFDTPIQRGERERIDHAFSSTYERLLNKDAASVVDIDAMRVLLQSQDVSVRELSGAAEVTLHDVYRNLTNAPQEVLYYFELPEDAVITGLWLGHSPDKTQAFAHRVAPRGAAQRVYKAQVRRRVDPALIEQVGPRQYRLRAYPVPVDRPLHMWMSYAARPQQSELPRPKVLERRNAFADVRTHYAFAGTKTEPQEGNEWVRVRIPTSLVPSERETVMLGGQLVQRIARDLCNGCEVAKGHGERIAIIVDRSRSMTQSKIEAELKWARDGLDGYNVDVVLAATNASGRPREVHALRDRLDLRPLGSSTFTTLFDTNLGDYAAVFVLTDDDGYDRAQDFASVGLPSALWMIHLGNPARAYPDAIGDALARRSSGIASTLSDAVDRWQAYATEPTLLHASEHDYWTGSGLVNIANTKSASPVEQIAAKMWIASRADNKGERESMHALAQAMNVVTPLSSMIVLVDEAQHRQLDQENAAQNKFDREAEDGKEKTPDARDAFALSATPEPEEWLLMIALVALVLVASQRQHSIADGAGFLK